MSSAVPTSGYIQYTWDGTLYVSRGHKYNFQNEMVFLSLKTVSVLANSVDVDEIWIFTVQTYACKEGLNEYTVVLIVLVLIGTNTL